MARPVHIHNMLKQLLTFGILLASATTVYCGDALQTTHPDNSTLQHQSKREYPMPYTSTILHPMYDGKEIHIEGVLGNKKRSFGVDLCETESCLIDIEMQADYRLYSHKFVINYKRNLRWGTAVVFNEKALQAGKTLNMKIVIQSHEIKILVNSKSFTFDKAIRMTKIKYLRLRGSAKINWIFYSWHNPPKYFRLNRHLQQQRLIIIGYPTFAHRFYFNFLHANQTEEPSDCMTQIVQLHFDSRFNMHGDVKKLLLNSKSGNGQFGTPTYIPISNFPFQVNVTFRVQITLRQNQFQFLFNNQDSYNFNVSTDGIEIICYNANVVVENIFTT